MKKIPSLIITLILICSLALTGCAGFGRIPGVAEGNAKSDTIEESIADAEGSIEEKIDEMEEESAEESDDAAEERNESAEESMEVEESEAESSLDEAEEVIEEAAENVEAAPKMPAGFVDLSEAIPDVMLDIRYYSTYNFVGDRIDGYEAPVALATVEAAVALKTVSEELKSKGYRLKIYDAYRPQRAVEHFERWGNDIEDMRMQPYFYPEIDNKLECFERGFIAHKSGHSRGSTIDLTIFDMQKGKDVDMGGTFDYFGELSHIDTQQITNEQRANRMILREAMEAGGFTPIAGEWWHFTLANEPYPDTYFDFSVTKYSN